MAVNHYTRSGSALCCPGLWCDKLLTDIIQGLRLFQLCELAGSGFWFGFSSVTASSAGGNGSSGKALRNCFFLYVLTLSNLHFCSVPGPNAPALTIL